MKGKELIYDGSILEERKKELKNNSLVETEIEYKPQKKKSPNQLKNKGRKLLLGIGLGTLIAVSGINLATDIHDEYFVKQIGKATTASAKADIENTKLAEQIIDYAGRIGANSIQTNPEVTKRTSPLADGVPYFDFSNLSENFAKITLTSVNNTYYDDMLKTSDFTAEEIGALVATGTTRALRNTYSAEDLKEIDNPNSQYLRNTIELLTNTTGIYQKNEETDIDYIKRIDDYGRKVAFSIAEETTKVEKTTTSSRKK